MTEPDPFAARDSLSSGQALYRLDRIVDPLKLPYTVCVLLENLLRRAGSEHVRGGCARPGGLARAAAGCAIAVHARARGHAGLHRRPCVVDLAAHARRDARAGRRPGRVNPLVPVDLVIDHSVQVDAFGSARVSSATSSASTSATASATRCCAGPRRRSRTSASCRRASASSTRSTSSTWPAVVQRARRRRRLPRHAGRHRLAHHHDQRRSACSAGASAASRPRPSCSASRSAMLDAGGRRAQA